MKTKKKAKQSPVSIDEDTFRGIQGNIGVVLTALEDAYSALELLAQTLASCRARKNPSVVKVKK